MATSMTQVRAIRVAAINPAQRPMIWKMVSENRRASSPLPNKNAAGRAPVVATGIVGLKITQRNFSMRSLLHAAPEKTFVREIDSLLCL